MFGRTKSAVVENNPIAAFWTWWSESKTRFEAVVGQGPLGETLEGELTGRVQTIDPGLEWEFSKGTSSKHALCVTAAGKSALRATSERWLIAGPAADAVWEYHSTRPADPSAIANTIGIAGHSVKVSEVRVVVSAPDDHQRVAVTVYHPSFAAMSESTRLQVAFLTLDWMLGEDGVERWIGAIDVITDEPRDSQIYQQLTAVIDDLAAQHAEGTWAILQGRDGEGNRMLIMSRRPLKRIEHPLFDMHGEIRIPYVGDNGEGLPSAPTLDELRSLESELEEFIRDQAIIVAHVTGANVRTFHVYCDGQTNTPARISAWLAEFHGVSATWRLDPSWELTSRFR